MTETPDEKKNHKPLIQEIGGDDINNKPREDVKTIGQMGEGFNWEIEQKMESTLDDGLLKTKYGFDNLV